VASYPRFAILLTPTLTCGTSRTHLLRPPPYPKRTSLRLIPSATILPPGPSWCWKSTQLKALQQASDLQEAQNMLEAMVKGSDRRPSWQLRTLSSLAAGPLLHPRHFPKVPAFPLLPP